MAATEVAFALEPLFKSVGVRRGRGVAPSGGVWRLATASAKLDDGDAWDHCHAILAQNDGVTLVEPDLEQQWTYGARPAANRNLGMRSGAPQPQDIGDGYAGDKDDDYWFRNNKHGQFDAALMATGGSGQSVRIAHLDTGYDPKHKSVPKNLRADLARNFVDADRPKDAPTGPMAPSTISATAAERSASWPARPFRDSSPSAARRMQRSSQSASPTGSLCSATALSPVDFIRACMLPLLVPRSTFG